MPKQTKFIAKQICLLLTISIFIACGQDKSQRKPDHVNLQLKWVHQAQFAGFYLAQELGFYADENITVDFLEGGKNVDIVTSLVTAKADFAVASSELVLTQRQKKAAPISAIAVIYRRSAVVFATMKGSGIINPRDFLDKNAAVIGISESHREFEYQFKALMKKQGMDINRIKLISYDPSYKDFYAGNVDITAAYYTGGAVRMRNKGHQINLIWPTDYGIHFYSDTLITTEKMIDQKPELVQRFLKASLRGWTAAIESPEAAVSSSMKYAKVKDRDLQAKMMSALIPLVHTGRDPIGWMRDDVWAQMNQVLAEQKILASPVIDLNKVYTLQFLKKFYHDRNK